MNLQTLSHASFTLESEGSVLLFDPWYSGRAYMGGWALDPPPLPRLLDALPRIDWIYLSHEHPDHTDHATLGRLFEGPARDATLLIPRFMTDRFARSLRGAFPKTPIRELKHRERQRIGPFEMRSYQYRNEDSLLAVRDASGFTVVNSNDSFIKGAPLRDLARLYPRVDLLLSQYTIANAYPYAYSDYGEPGRSFPWEREDLLRYCIDLLETLRPECWIPYHSFVKFSRPDNQFLNQYHFELDEIVERVRQARPPSQVLRVFPGERLEGTRHIPDPEVEAHFRSHRVEVRPYEGSVAPEDLSPALERFERDFRSDVSGIFRRRLRPLGFCLESEEHLLFDPHACRFQRGGPELRRERPDCSWTQVESATLVEALREPWGMGNLLISGCIRTTVPDEWRGRDFLFWALSLVRQTGYFDLRSLWFLRRRAWGTALRRRVELLEILRSSLRSGGFLEGNIEPHRLVEDPETQPRRTARR